MARSIPQQLEYQLEVLDTMNKWNLPEAEYAKGLDWYETVNFGSYFATGLKLQFILNGVSGMLLAASTAESTRICKQNEADNKEEACYHAASLAEV